MKFTYPDEILKEVWAVKERIGARYKGNVSQFLKDLRQAQAASTFAVGVPSKKLRRPRSVRKTG